jgi:hypothetical protein
MTRTIIRIGMALASGVLFTHACSRSEAPRSPPATGDVRPSATTRDADTPDEMQERIATMTSLRERGWQLLLDVVRTEPSFMESSEWHHEQAAFRKPGEGPITRGLLLSRPDELLEPDPAVAATLSVRDDFKLYESTFYNSAAVQHIQNTHLYDPLTTLVLLQQRRREIDEFPSTARVVKTFWRAIPPGGSAKVGVWRWKLPNDSVRIPEWDWERYMGTPPVCVATKADPQSGCLTAERDFVYTTVANATLFDCSSSCEELSVGQTLVLVGIHIISKERADWFWSTFWWQGVSRTDGTNRDANGQAKVSSWTCDNAQRPKELSVDGLTETKRAWSNYSMDVLASFTWKKPEVAPEDIGPCGRPGVLAIFDPDGKPISEREELLASYNPFVEGVRTNGRKSSCLDCHGRPTTAEDNPGIIPSVGRTDRYPGLMHFEGHIRTDYLWTLKDHLATTPK